MNYRMCADKISLSLSLLQSYGSHCEDVSIHKIDTHIDTHAHTYMAMSTRVYVDATYS